MISDPTERSTGQAPRSAHAMHASPGGGVRHCWTACTLAQLAPTANAARDVCAHTGLRAPAWGLGVTGGRQIWGAASGMWCARGGGRGEVACRPATPLACASTPFQSHPATDGLYQQIRPTASGRGGRDAEGRKSARKAIDLTTLPATNATPAAAAPHSLCLQSKGASGTTTTTVLCSCAVLDRVPFPSPLFWVGDWFELVALDTPSS